MKLPKEDSFLITFSDILDILKRSRKRLILGSLLIGLLAGLYTLSLPVNYKAEATFREKSKSQGESGRSLSLALIAGITEGSENTTVSLMKSRKLMEQVIIKQDMQGVLEKGFFNFERLKNIGKHLKVEYALLRKRLVPVVNDPKEDIKATKIDYLGEVPIELKIKFTSEDTFVLKSIEGKTFSGELGIPFKGHGFSFILVAGDERKLSGKTYDLTLLPLKVVWERILPNLKIETDPNNKGLINLTLKYPDRYLASGFLNDLMKVYQTFLKEEHQRICGEQIEYLHDRQDETGKVLKAMMEEHAHSMSNNMATIDFLFQNQQNYTQKLLMINLELSRLQKADEEGFVFYDKYGWDGGDSSVINQILGEIRTYRQQADSIDISLRNTPLGNPDLLKESFNAQHKELDALAEYAEEAKIVYASLANNEPIPPLKKLVENPKYMMREWQEKLEKYAQEKSKGSQHQKESATENYECCRKNFNAYVGNLIHLLDVEQKIFGERLAHQQSTPQEYQGINLETAKQLYLSYSRSLNDLEADIMHQQFLLKQMEDPNFEVSALSTVLDDSVSRDIIAKTSNLTLLLKDQDNRSLKELERIKGELAQQKGFLTLHLKQTAELLNLRKKLYQDKILSLQNTTLELIQQTISVLEQQLTDYIHNRMGNLSQEKGAIEQQQQLLQKEMAKLPTKWAAEKLIDQHLEMSKKMIEKITEAVETKNISSHIDISQSAPLDESLPPIHPASSKLLLVFILGSLAGGFILSFGSIGKSIFNGVRASPENLALYGQKVAGTLQKPFPLENSRPIFDHDLETLRRLVSYLSKSPTENKEDGSILLLTGNGMDFSKTFAELLAKSGFKTLLIDLSFDDLTQQEASAGLMPYLEGQTDFPIIQREGRIDRITAGGFSRFSNEYVSSPRFQLLKESLLTEYDWVISVSHASPISGEGQNLLKLFNTAIITLTDETLPDLEPCFNLAALEKRILYIFTNHAV